ncbi:MAG: hypothetical protein UY44_C0010G0001, partial [Candidatus Kaiserbacteria bacterium GW2011_GWA2_49_19]
MFCLIKRQVPSAALSFAESDTQYLNKNQNHDYERNVKPSFGADDKESGHC